MPKPLERRERGLKSVHDMREARHEGRFAKPTEKMYLAIGVALALILGGYWYFTSKKLDRQKGDLLAKRNAVDATIGAEWYPLRDKLEKIVIDEGANLGPDFVEPAASTWEFQKKPGVYLRLRVIEAKDSKSIHKAAENSVRDGFVGCLIVSPNPALARGDADAGAFGENPWNLRQAYQATRILTDDWQREVRESSDDLRLRVFTQQYDKAIDTEIPLAAKIIKQADFFLLVLDEDVPEARLHDDAGMVTSESLQVVSHPARVILVDLHKDPGIMLRIRRTTNAGFRFVGDNAVQDPETLAAMQRQVNNCALANEVKSVLAPAKEAK